MSERVFFLIFGLVALGIVLYSVFVTIPDYFGCLNSGGVPVQVWGGYACAAGNG